MVKIYKIINKETEEVVYVGSTIKSLQERGKQHKKDILHTEKYNYLRDNKCAIVLICECDDKDRRKIEQRWITFYYPILNRRDEIENSRKKLKQQIDMKKAEEKAKEILKKMSKK